VSRRLILAALLACGLFLGVTATAEAQRSRGGRSRSYSTRTYRAPRSSYRAPRVRSARATAYRPARVRNSVPRANHPRTYTSTRAPRARNYAVGGRDSRGRIRRSQTARHDFMRATGYPRGRPGYIIDHVVPLACGGADAPSNMQWQTRVAAKAKDRTERVGCSSGRRR
jgi:hypothetical protein